MVCRMGKSQSDMLKQNCKKQCYPVLVCQVFRVSNRKFHIFTLANRPFALRGHVSFAAMLEGKQIGCYALLWNKWLPLMTRKGKYIKFPRHFLLCFKTMGYLRTCMMCTSLSDSIKNRSFIYCFKKSLSMFRLLQQFEHTSSLFELANL